MDINVKVPAWFVTIFDMNDNQRGVCHELMKESEYAILAEETCPTTGKEHYHLYFRKKWSCWGTALLKRFMRGDGQSLTIIPVVCKRGENRDLQNQRYLQKGGCFEEKGKPYAKGRAQEIVDVIEMIKDRKGNIEDTELYKTVPTLMFGHDKALDRCRRVFQPKKNWVPKVVFLWGPPGSGKTTIAHVEYGGERIILNKHGFVQSYTNQECVIIDEFDKIDHELWNEQLLIMTDGFPCNVNVKGGEMRWNPKTIVLCSNKCLNDIVELNEAFKRRVTEDYYVYEGRKSERGLA